MQVVRRAAQSAEHSMLECSWLTLMVSIRCQACQQHCSAALMAPWPLIVMSARKESRNRPVNTPSTLYAGPLSLVDVNERCSP